ncbi:hypothetical protein LSPH26S_03829 [Lysinibacillus sphaericus]
MADLQQAGRGGRAGQTDQHRGEHRPQRAGMAQTGNHRAARTVGSSRRTARRSTAGRAHAGHSQLLTEAGQKNLPGGYVRDDHRGVEAAASNDPTRSPETYVGYARARFRRRPGGTRRGARLPRAGRLRFERVVAHGRWTVHDENAQLDQAGGAIVYRFRGRDLHLVLGPAAESRSASA